jgi:hypothetical protein
MLELMLHDGLDGDLGAVLRYPLRFVPGLAPGVTAFANIAFEGGTDLPRTMIRSRGRNSGNANRAHRPFDSNVNFTALHLGVQGFNCKIIRFAASRPPFELSAGAIITSYSPMSYDKA